MKKAYDFDIVFDSQKIFRLIMEALSNPGRIVCIDECKDRLYGDHKELLAIGVTFLDNEVSFNTCGNQELSQEIISMTLSKEELISQADYIFISENKPEAAVLVVTGAKCGTLKDPHQSATIITGVKNLEGHPNAVISGPGVNGHKEVFLTQFMKQMIETRDNMFYEYPTGIDFIFIDSQGSLTAIPRKIKVEV
ncbi:MAG: phosphonate C-P lyase system protein PhnH [Eubacteriales bacterium]